MCPDDKRLALSYGPLPPEVKKFVMSHPYKINCDYLKFNLFEECDREIEVSYWPMLPLINESVPLEEADYIIYGHFYARFHNLQEIVKDQLEYLIENRKPGTPIIVVGKSCNIRPFLDPEVKDIIFFESHYAEKLGEYFNLPIKDQYFVYDEKKGWLNVWPVDGCKRACKFCRRSYMHIPFESLPLEVIKQNLDWYQENQPERLEHITLRAENLTEYGIDIYGRQALPDLIQLLNSYKEIKEISVQIGIAIGEINDEILDSLCECKKLTSIYMNIEAGTDRLLEEIGKGHTVEQAKKVFKRLREENPKVSITTNVMIGLPTEGIEDIIELASLINEIEPDYVYTLRYRMDPNQPLAKYEYMSDQLWAYHLKLFLRQLKKGDRSIPLTLDTIMVPKYHSRSYIREMIKNKKDQEYSYEDLDLWDSFTLPATISKEEKEKTLNLSSKKKIMQK